MGKDPLFKGEGSHCSAMAAELSKFGLAYAVLAASKALLGRVFPELRAVTVNITDKVLRADFFYHGEVEDSVIEELEIAATEIECDFPVGFTLETRIERLDMPAKVPVDGRLVYLRSE